MSELRRLMQTAHCDSHKLMPGYQLYLGGPTQHPWRVLWQRMDGHKQWSLYFAKDQNTAESLVALMKEPFNRVLGSIADETVRAVERLRGSRLTNDELIELIEGQAKE